MLIHGHSGVGKTPVANTVPGPRLLIDTEGGWQWLRNHTVVWDPRTEDPRNIEGITEDTTVVVRITDDFQVLDLVYQWLASGGHPFKSLVIDSLTEMQEKMKRTISIGAFEQNHWGTLLERMNTLILQFKDLADDSAPFPLDCVVFTAGSVYSEKVQKKTAFVQGQLLVKLPYKVSVVAYMDRTPDDLPYFLISPLGEIDAKDRTGYLKEHYGQYIQANPETQRLNLRELMAVLNPEINQESVA